MSGMVVAHRFHLALALPAEAAADPQ